MHFSKISIPFHKFGWSNLHFGGAQVTFKITLVIFLRLVLPDKDYTFCGSSSQSTLSPFACCVCN